MIANGKTKSPIQLEMRLDRDKLREPFHKLRKSLAKDSKDPTPKQVHKLRSQIRRVQTIIDGLMLDKTPAGKEALKMLKPLYKKAGQVRDVDVEVGLAGTLDLKAEDRCFIGLVEYLASQRIHHSNKLRHSLAKRKKPLLQSLKKCEAIIEEIFATAKSDSLRKRKKLKQASAFARGVTTELALWSQLKADNLHSYRRKLKELREILQLTGSEDRKLIDDLGEIKDSIGAWHDWNELAAAVSEKLDHGSQCELSRQARAAEKEHFAHALAQTNALRKKYFAGKLRVAHAIDSSRSTAQKRLSS